MDASDEGVEDSSLWIVREAGRWYDGRYDDLEAAMLTRAEDHDGGCPICRGELPQDIIETVLISAASQCAPMSVDEFRVWLDGLDPSP